VENEEQSLNREGEEPFGLWENEWPEHPDGSWMSMFEYEGTELPLYDQDEEV